jgi:SAM-dependent methyltransferase
MRPDAWWDEVLKDRSEYEKFRDHLGDPNMASRILVRELSVAYGIANVLDVGCGPAHDRWTDTGIHWTGVDGSKLLIADAAKRGADITFGKADALPFEDKTFDLVYSRHVWEHLPTFRGALSEACRVAKSAVAVTFFQPPGDTERVVLSTGAYYNWYRRADIEAGFRAAWPGCEIDVHVLGQGPNLPHGESVFWVTCEE